MDKISVTEFCRESNPDLEIKIELCIKIAARLNEIHNQNITLGILYPNIVLTDKNTLDISLNPPADNGKDRKHEILDTITLEYISPEAATWGNRTIDYRSDYYSLGIIFYEILSGSPPFSDPDPARLIHAHLARNPLPLNKKIAGLPDTISSIVMKLLEKNPDDRYQSFHGLMHDLKYSLEQFMSAGEIKYFAAGSHDVSPVFRIPDKLYGRHKEICIIARLLSEAENCRSRSLFVSGPPGIGKSFLVSESLSILKNDNSYCVTGKFEQYNETEPYAAFIQAFRSLIIQLLSESEEVILSYKNRIQTAIGNNGKILTDMIPELIHIIGPQKEAERINPQEAQNRFQYLLYNFIRIFADKDHTLILFIDDIQWADKASIDLMKLFFSDSSLSLLLIGAYRNAELTLNIYASEFLNNAPQNSTPARFLELSPVNKEYAAALLEDLFSDEMQENTQFIELLLKKTGGNPLFIKEMLMQLHRQGHIFLKHIDDDRKGWYYNSDEIVNTQFPDTLGELIAKRITLLPDNVKLILKTASCMNKTFSSDLVAGVNGMSITDVDNILTECVKENLMVAEEGQYCFIHDKVQEAVYTSIPTYEITRLHYKTGLLLFEKFSSDENFIFQIVNHLNLSKTLITDKNEKERLIRLNYNAAIKSKKSVAFYAMHSFLIEGIGLLEKNCWMEQYDITFPLYREYMECESIIKNFEESGRTLNLLIQNAESDIEKAEIYSLSVQLLNVRADFAGTIEHARLGLKILNNKIYTFERSYLRIILEILKFKLYYTIRDKNCIMGYLPDNDRKENITGQILVDVSFALSIENIDAALLLFFQEHNNYLKRKLITTRGIASNLMGIAVALATGLHDYNSAYHFGTMSVESVHRYHTDELKGRAYFVFALSISHWKHHAEKSISRFRESCSSAFRNGDFFSAINSVIFMISYRFIIGHNLKDILNELRIYREIFILHFSDSNAYMINYQKAPYFINRMIYGLDNGSENQEYLNPPADEISTLSIFNARVNDLKYNYIFENHHRLLDDIPFLSKNILSAVSSLMLPEFIFYYSLSITALWETAKTAERRKFRRILKTNTKKMKMWAGHSPENFLHKYLLIQAESSRIYRSKRKDGSGVKQNAETLYEMAIQTAHDQRYINNEAIANECAAKYYLHCGISEKFINYLLKAYSLYKEWGAEAKCRQLKTNYPELGSDKTIYTDNKPNDRLNADIKTESSISFQAIDLSTIQWAASGMSGIHETETAIKKILGILNKSTGAKRAALVFYNGNDLYLSASIESIEENEDIFNIHGTDDKNEIPDLPVSIIRFVKNTGNKVNLEEIRNRHFFDDPYIKQNGVKSALCQKLVNLENKEVIMYLENDRLPGIFNDRRMALLDTIAIQITAFLENILLKNMLSEKYTDNKLYSEVPIENILQTKYLFTLQEVKIALMLKNGTTREEVCDELSISYKTLKNHLYSMYSKTVNMDEDHYASTGRIDKLSRFLIFLLDLEKKSK